MEHIRNIQGRVGVFPYMFPCVFLDLWSQQKTSPLFSGGFRPHLELLGHDRHVQSPTFGQISHVSGAKLSFRDNFIMVLHGFAWRS